MGATITTRVPDDIDKKIKDISRIEHPFFAMRPPGPGMVDKKMAVQ